MTEHLARPIGDIARSLRAGEVKAEALAEEAIANHDRYDPPLGAYKTWDAGHLLAQARAADAAAAAGRRCGPLHGLPVSVKDLFGVRGFPTFAGSPKRLPAEWEAEGGMVRALRAQLGLVTGKSHTVEFAFGGLGTNPHWGTPRNPWDAENSRVPGGSSAGAGVSLGQGTAILAFGSDTGGSVRIPASLTGNVGIKTSAGRWPTDGCVPLSPTLDTVGLLGRSVADLAYGFAALDPHLGAPEPFLAEIGRTDPSDLTIGVCENGVWDGCSPGVAEAARAAIDEMAAKGARIVALDFPEMADAYAMHLKGSVISAEFDAFLSRRLPDWIEALDPTVRRRVEDGGNITARELLDRYATLGDMTRRAHARLAEVDVLAAPTIPVTPPTFEEVAALEDHVRINRQMFRNTCPGNLLTLCGLTVPVGLDGAGMPVGLTLFGPAGADERLFAAGAALESVIGTPRERIGTPPMGPRP